MWSKNISSATDVDIDIDVDASDGTDINTMNTNTNTNTNIIYSIVVSVATKEKCERFLFSRTENFLTRTTMIATVMMKNEDNDTQYCRLLPNR